MVRINRGPSVQTCAELTSPRDALYFVKFWKLFYDLKGPCVLGLGPNLVLVTGSS